MKDVIIIGAGLFGCVIAKQLQTKGMDVTIIDSNEELAGSKAAACLMKPSWYSSMGKDAYIPAMETLEALYGVETIEFKTRVKKTKVSWISPRKILNPKVGRINSKVYEIFKTRDKWTVNDYSDNYHSRNIILAGGVWCNTLLMNSNLPLVDNLHPLIGTSFQCLGETTPEISVWNPYKQLVKFNINESYIWTGDGVTSKNYWEKKYLSQSLERCANFIGKPPGDLWPTTGHRPYVKDAKPCYLEEHAPNLWVVTGGAKNGTIAAGWAAYELSKRIAI